ncbi:hypothetical protein BU25DRAFT_484495 [Macroventuria anomochaeta]|uniref:Uncharacterized protein n=1 Tax=Macroventuria anomochaeta TaxID=301207 RepID=A0ACB6SAS7_9PLEO|nr:uncharacterized protein BU25DRAFT_484495 [Macroventuria anomochaeta]KAF2630419.1 hypothetical protein BU25DRAFT_484495 [Macroventuria anomochaeta]
MKLVYTKKCKAGSLFASGILFLVAIAIICWQASYSYRPGPKYYYSHFSGLQFACALAFDALQVLRLVSQPYNRDLYLSRTRLLQIFTNTYWIVLSVSAFACAIGYGLTPKPDATAIQVLIFLNSAVALMKVIIDRISLKGTGTQAMPLPDSKRFSQSRRWFLAVSRNSNRLFKFMRFALSILFIVGAVQLAMQYRFKNPGTISRVDLASGASLSINYYCTTVPPTNSSSLSTIWFESDGAHGITDFIGVQTILADLHGRNSCSYDSPNFGFSSRLPSSEPTDLTTVFNPLVHAIQRENETKILVGWGGGGENVLRHAKQNPSTTRGVVLLDVSPNGIEWLDQKRTQNLTMEETVTLAKLDLEGRASLTQTILGVGLPWGLLPVFIPANATGYFDKSLYPRHHAQSLKEDLWAMQYYSIRSMLPDPFSPILESLSVPEGLPVYMVASYVAGTDDASSAFYRDEKSAPDPEGLRKNYPLYTSIHGIWEGRSLVVSGATSGALSYFRLEISGYAGGVWAKHSTGGSITGKPQQAV